MVGARIYIPKEQVSYHMKKYRSVEEMRGMQEQLFDLLPPPRPNYYGPEIKEAIVPDIVSAIMNCDRVNCADLDLFVEDVSNMLDEITTENFCDYSNYLSEVCGWKVDEQINSVLSKIPYMRHDAYEDLVHDWVLFNGVKPKYSAGQFVSFDHKQYGLLHGEITSVALASAEYYLAADIKEPDGQVDTHLFVRKYEDIIEQVVTHGV